MKWSGIAALLALIVAVLALYQSNKQRNESAPEPIFSHTKTEKPDVEIADFMQFLLPFHEKIYWAMEGKNKELSEFYVHEMGEKMLELAKADVWHEGRNMSEDMKTFGLKPLDILKKSLANNGNITEAYTNLTTGCNTCHEAHKVPFVKIKVPDVNRFSNQDFGK